MSIIEQLEKFQEHYYWLASLNDEIETLEIAIDAIGGFSYEGMPRGTNISRPTERKAIALAEKKKEFEQQAIKISAMMGEIMNLVNEIKDPRTRYIIRAKYISFRGFEEIGARCQPKISGKQAKRLHDKGIEELERNRRLKNAQSN